MRVLVAVAYFRICSALASQQQNIRPVVGLQTGYNATTNAPPSRRSINDLAVSGPQWDLFIQGLSLFQQVPEEDDLSYFRISGIHGRPYVSWNGVDQAEGAPLTGYCTHNEVLFAIWHRPLVALYEQILAEHVQKAAKLYTGSLAAIYQSAADTWRAPYWDWAAPESLPDIVSEQNVTIKGPNGTVTVRNPLRTYRFQHFPLDPALFPTDCDTDYKLWSYPETLRCPDPATNKSNNGMSNGNVGCLNLAAEVYNVYTRINTFESMSTTGSSGLSFENQHNEVHVAVGGLHPMGHFAHLGYSGFDPVFMMHHAAIDRHVALWQAIHYNASMFASAYATQTGQFATAPGTTISADSPLKPFYRDAEGTFHTGNSARDVRSFGYIYPELEGAFDTAEDLRRNVTVAVNRLYGGKQLQSKRSASGDQHFGSSVMTMYSVKVTIDKAGFRLPATVQVWLGDFQVGHMILPVAPERGIMYGHVALQEALEAVGMSNKTHEAVIPLLEQDLRWSVIKPNGEEASRTATSSIQVEVHKEDEFQAANEWQFPQYANLIRWRHVNGALVQEKS